MSDLSLAEQRAARDARILAAVARGEAIPDIAVREGVHEKTVRRALKRDRDRKRSGGDSPVELDVPSLVEIDPSRELAEVLAASRYSERELRTLAASTTNDAVKTGALKASAQIARDRLGLLVEVGLCPPAAQWMNELNYEAISRALFETAMAAGLSADDWRRALQDRLDGNPSATELRVVGVGPKPGMPVREAA